MESLRGQLLVAGPGLFDPNFRRTVVLVCEHSEAGALGIVLNRPTAIDVAEAVPELIGVIAAESRLWAGGPVQPASIVLLAEFDEPGDALLVLDDLGLVLQGSDLDSLAARTRRTRAFLGYAGWGAGQLEDEMERDDWIVAPAVPDDAFEEDPGGMWRRALERKGGRYALIATMPPDPSLN